MPIKNSNIRAFTILEAVITLVISALLIAFVYQIYTGISLQFKNYAIEQEATIEYSHLSLLLAKDISQSQHILKADEQGIELQCSDKIISYHFSDKVVVRVSTQLDTFNIEVVGVEHKNLLYNEDLKREAIIINTRVLGRELKIFESKELHIAHKINNQFADVN